MIALLFMLQPVLPVPGDELHVIAVYESKVRQGGQDIPVKVQVVVNRPRKNVTLFLSGYEPCGWEVIAGPRTNVTKVILGGSHAQAAEVPKGAAVVDLFRGSPRLPPGQRYIYAYYKIDSGRFRPSARAIRTFTGMDLSSFQGSYNYDPLTPFVIKAVQNDERLSSDYPKLTPAGQLPKLEFRGAFSTPAGRHQFATGFGSFTQAGPDKASVKPAPARVSDLAHDPGSNTYYGIASHAFHEVDLEKGTTAKLEPGAGLPKVSWPCGITFDTKRGRMVVATFGGEDFLYTYTPKTKAWTAVSLNNLGLSALAYHPKDDNLYGLSLDLGDGASPKLYQLNANGALVKTTELGHPMFPGVLGRGPVDCRVHMASAGDWLAVLVASQGSRDGDGAAGQPELFLYLIDPKTGAAKLAWKE